MIDRCCHLDDFWEVDLWGRIRQLNEAAGAQFLATLSDFTSGTANL